MRYEIDGGNLPYVTVKLNSGESVYTESGAMAWMSDNIKMDTNMKGGLFGGVKRVFSGESLFVVNFTSHGEGEEIGFVSSFPGSILPVDLSGGKSIIVQKRAFLFAESGVDFSIYFQKRLGTGFFGGEGFIMQRFSGDGIVFLEIDGSLKEVNLQPGQKIKVDTGHVVMFEEGVHMDVETVKGFKNIFFGGEGLFLTTLTGPGKVYLQSMPMSNFANNIASFLPVSGS